MAEYRVQAKARAPASTIESTAVPAFTHLFHDMQLGASWDSEAQTLEQEFQSYVTAPLSVEGTNLLRFWEVRNILFSRY